MSFCNQFHHLRGDVGGERSQYCKTRRCYEIGDATDCSSATMWRRSGDQTFSLSPSLVPHSHLVTLIDKRQKPLQQYQCQTRVRVMFAMLCPQSCFSTPPGPTSVLGGVTVRWRSRDRDPGGESGSLAGIPAGHCPIPGPIISSHQAQSPGRPGLAGWWAGSGFHCPMSNSSIPLVYCTKR